MVGSGRPTADATPADFVAAEPTVRVCRSLQFAAPQAPLLDLRPRNASPYEFSTERPLKRRHGAVRVASQPLLSQLR